MTVTSTPEVAPELMHRLEEVVATAWHTSFYRQHWGCRHWEDVLAMFRAGRFHELPVIRKQHLRDHLDDIVDFGGAVDVVSSSGTTGRPVDLPVHSLDDQSRVLRVRRVLRELGLAPGGLVLQLLSLNDLFTLGPLAWQAARAEGCCVLRCSPQRVERVIQVCRQNRPGTVMGNAAVLVRMAQDAAGAWPEPGCLPSRGFLGVSATFDADLNPTPAASEAARLWGLTLILNHYGCSELGPVAYECREHQGLHVHDDHHLVELIDTVTGLPVTGPDQPGEIVATALTVPRGFLPVRYATGDVAAWLRRGQCPCGRVTPRLGPVIGRVDHQLKVYGQTVYPDLLLNIADRCPAVRRSAVYVTSNPISGDQVRLLLVPALGADPAHVLAEVSRHLIANLAVSPEVAVTDDADLDAREAAAIQGGNMVKIPRFFDLRNPARAGER
jgi:phenylacetate-CoA ligase